MSIAKMKYLELVGLSAERDRFLAALQPYGCVEISDPQRILEDPEKAALLRCSSSKRADREAEQLRLQRALQVLKTYSKEKSPMFPKRKQLKASELLSEDVRRRASEAADQILKLERDIDGFRTEESRLETEIMALTPWEGLDLPLEFRGTRYTRAMLGAAPGGTAPEDIAKGLDESGTAVELIPAGQDPEQTCVLAVYHANEAEAAEDALRSCGVSPVTFPGRTGTAKENLTVLRGEIVHVQQRRKRREDAIAGLSGAREALQLAWDRAGQELRREEARAKLVHDGRIFAMTGWLPAAKAEKLDEMLEGLCCCWEIRDPVEGDDVPTKLENNALTRPLNMVTEMYSLPAYDGVDPNPLMFPFFTVFFGIMFADMGYGLLLLAIWALGTFKLKPKGTLSYMVGLCGICGVTTFLFGALTGGFFGDAIPVLADMFGGHVTMPALFSPLEDPMLVLIGALVLGVVHILTGMAIKGWMLIRDGHWKDAVMDIGSWWLLFLGIALGALGITWWVCIAGVAALILTQGRDKPTFIGKLVGGIASLYDITSYLGDILSYSRLMALMLAGGVIASIMNTLGAFTGNIILFIPIFLVGHALNIGLNVLGCYVHTSRLMYLEYFGKFYKDGGRPFRPLQFETKYVDIQEEP